jgi:Endonuclease NucS
LYAGLIKEPILGDNVNNELTRTLSLRAAYAFGISKGLEREINSIRDMVIEWDLSYTSSLRRGYVVELFERHAIYDEFKANHWPFGNTPAGEKKHLFYIQTKKRYEDFLAGRGDEVDGELEDEIIDEEQQFAAESDLRDFLAKNPGCIEPGLRLYHAEDQAGVEYAIEGGRIDILALDREGRFVVIELKVGRGRNKTVGQLLYYMGWVDKHLSKTPCRGMIIAKEISDDLVLAVQRANGVSLHRYKLSVLVEPVSAKP